MTISIKFFKQADLGSNVKITVHRTGKMGFTENAASKLSLPNMESANIGYNELDPGDDRLYMELYESSEVGTFKIHKAGQYYYINGKLLLDTLKIDYTTVTTLFDITVQEIGNKDYYVLTRRTIEKKKKPLTLSDL
jgi:hypothetical protein